MLIALNRVSLGYGAGLLLDEAEFVLQEGERVGLIGRNGTGKSTLMKLVDGRIAADSGELVRAPGLRSVLLDQEPVFDPGLTVEQVIAGGFGEIAQVFAEHQALAHAEDTPANAQRMQWLHDRLDHERGWDLPSRVSALLLTHGFDGATLFDTLSGGGRKRVALVRALAGDPDLLLLDEPTNHLDMEAIEWLEDTLLGFRGAVIVVSHDRRFLDRVITRIIELDRGQLASYPGSFRDYKARKAQQLADEAVAAARFDKRLAEEEVWIRKGIEARRTRNEGRVRRLEQLRRDRAARRERIGQVGFKLAAGDSSGELVAELDHVSVALGGRTLIRDFSTRIVRGDRIGLVGPNGAGKTTLLRILLGELQVDEGKARLGTRLEIAYFDQFRAQLDPDARLTDVVSPGSEFVEIGGTRQHVIGYLSEFLFPPQRARSPVSALSGGERNRLLLARLFARPANLLVLDEPTNDLDIETLDLLESLLAEYKGTVLVVSHDREFLDNVTTQVIAFAGDGQLVEIAGGYSDWQRYREGLASATVTSTGAAPGGKAAPAAPAPAQPLSAPATSPTAPTPKQKPRLSFKETRELEAIPATIEGIESEIAAVGLTLADPATYARDPAELKALQARLAKHEDDLANAMQRWEDLERKARGDAAG
ncbi:MAG: ATP-binding cassette domain-containing protein [bacterium]|jgi:ATP-binding cassette subfamily F protein uup|nr:ATP-binding cassette domain-containing protein [Betaproteobacteria bacterium]